MCGRSVADVQYSKKRLADSVIFIGMAVNAVVIGLILYYFVL